MTTPGEWFCLGVWPLVKPCDATGSTDATAEKHLRTGHAVGDAIVRAAIDKGDA